MSMVTPVGNHNMLCSVDHSYEMILRGFVRVARELVDSDSSIGMNYRKFKPRYWREFIEWLEYLEVTLGVGSS